MRADANQQRRKNVSALLKDLEKQQAEKKLKPTMRRRLEQAGLAITPRTFYIISASAALVAVATCVITQAADPRAAAGRLRRRGWVCRAG